MNKPNPIVELREVDESEEDEHTSDAPTVTFGSVTFSDGNTIELNPTDIVVFVGPNNAGKSVALRELREFVRNPAFISTVVKQALVVKVGSEKQLERHVAKNSDVRFDSRGAGYRWGYGFNIRVSYLNGAWSGDLADLRDFFCSAIETETRISGSNEAPSINTRKQQPTHPIHLLYSDEELEKKIGGFFRQAFGKDLIVDHFSGNVIPLVVGSKRDLSGSDDRLSKTYRESLTNSTTSLEGEGDGMRSFATVLLHLLAPSTQTILLLDEPEAFLHPPQARLLGRIIATEKRTNSQLFVATHSPDVLLGLIDAAPDRVRVLRMQRDEKVNKISELDNELVRQIGANPLMKFSSVMSGVFHDRVIICEGDSDCMFYSSILELSEVRGEHQPDVIFVHAGTKDRMASLAKTLKALDVSVDVIADIDVLNDTAKFVDIVDALGGPSSNTQTLAKAVKNAVEQRRPWLGVSDVKVAVGEILDGTVTETESVRRMRREINKVFAKATPWESVKNSGASAIPSGQPTRQFEELDRTCKEIGLWMVPVGEMEGFCKSVDYHGPAWVQQVIQKKLLESDELKDGREFVKRIWESK